VRLARAVFALGLLLMLVASTVVAPVAAGNGVDITNTSEGRAKIKASAASFNAQGSSVSEADLVALKQDDGAILVVRKGYQVIKTVDGYRTVTPGGTSKSGSQLQGTSALTAASWSLLGSACYAALWRGAAHMDACHRRYKMASDGDATKDYWRIDLYATMFAEGRYLDWGWVAADRDAGPALSFVDWSPDADIAQACGSYGLNITVVGVGGGFTTTFCELNNISKSAGATVGWFKDYWDWDGGIAHRDRDRRVALEVGASSTQGTGTPTWGLSWNFSASD